MMQADIYNVLSNDSAIAALCGARIYPKRMPQGTTVPAIVYTINDITPVKSLSGESGLDNGTVEIKCWAENYTTAHLIAAAVRSAFVASGIAVVTGSLEDTEDEDTHNFGVVMLLNAWSNASVGSTPQNLKNPIASMPQVPFTGDGVTTSFTLPKFREGTLIVFFNGRLAKKGAQSDPTVAYWEKSTLDGFVFRTAPKGGAYADELLAIYIAA